MTYAILRIASTQDLQRPAITAVYYEVGYGLAVRLHLDDV